MSQPSLSVTPTPTKEGMPLDLFWEIQEKTPFELLDGEKVYLMPTVTRHSLILRILFTALWSFLLEHRYGQVFFETTFILPDRDDPNWVRGSRVPDLMFYTQERYARYVAQTPDWQDKAFTLIPDLVVEIISFNDTFSTMTTKVDRYLADGVSVVWVIDPHSQVAYLYRAQQQFITRLEADGVLEDALLGEFKMPLAELFKEPTI